VEENKVGTMQALVDSGVAQKQQPATEAKTPSESIAFKDLPPEGQAQMAQQAGINITPQHIMADQANKQVQQQQQAQQDLQHKVILSNLKGGQNATKNGQQPSSSQQ
jgi:hypothetical protein